MSANIVICPLCNELATVVDMTPAPRFAWCDKCRALHSPPGPHPAVPARATSSKKSKSKTRPTSKKPKASRK